LAYGLLAKPIDDYHLDPANARINHDVDRIAASLSQYGQRTPIVVNTRENGKIEKGNGTWKAAKALGWSHIAVVAEDDDPMTAVGYGITDNRTSDLSGWDFDVLDQLISSLDDDVFTGFKEGEWEEIVEGVEVEYDGQVGRNPDNPSLAERFVVPPFSVLDARQGYWQDRKRAWLSLGIQSELGRGGEDSASFKNQDKLNALQGSTLGAIAPNESGTNGILTRTGKYAVKSGGGKDGYAQ
jgi:hypothetical protein